VRIRPTRGAIAIAVVTLVLAGAVSACSPKPDTIVEVDAGSVDDTATLTPLERGTARREALDAVRGMIDGWMASNADAMRLHAADSVVAPFAEAFATYAAEGRRVEHVHDVIYLDVVDLNREGTQALVTYRYNDSSVVVDGGGATVETLPVLREKEMQLTLDLTPEGWTVVRIIAGTDAYR